MQPDRPATGLRSLTRQSDEPAAAVPMRPYPWKTRLALPASVVAAVLAVAGWSARDALLPAMDVRVIPVVLKPVAGAQPAATAATAATAAASAPAGGSVVTQAAGWVEPDPYAVAVTALTDGVLKEVLVQEGQRVAAGEVVARLIDDDARLAVRRAEAELVARAAELTAAQRQWDNPVERRRAVAATRAALDEARAELAKLDADIAAEQARARELADLANRLEQAVAARASGELELAAARFKLEAQRASLTATEARRPVLEALLRQRAAEADAAGEAAELRIDEARALDAAKAAVMLAEAVLAESRLRLERTSIRSPADGVVMSRMAEPGGKMMLAMDSPHSSTVARLYDPSKLQVRVDVPLADAHKVGVGTPAEITVEALPGRTLSGVVKSVVNEADVAKNTLQFKVRIADPPDGLKPEMLARVKFLAAAAAASKESGVGAASAGGAAHLPFVPESLLRDDAGGTYVLLADRRSGAAVRRAVTRGDQRAGDWVAVASGLGAGDDVIADPTGVSAGTRIRVVGEAPATASATAAATPSAGGKAGQ